MPAPSPVNRLPPVVVALVAAILAVEALLQLGARGMVGGPEAVGWRMRAITAVGFSDPLFEHMRTTGTLRPDGLWRMLSYGAVHLGPMHALLGAVLLLALGKAVSERFSTPAMLAVLAAGSVGGALAYGFGQSSPAPLVGAYPAVYGLIGAYTWSLHAAGAGRQRLMAFRLVGLLIGLQLLFRVLFGGGNEWVADLGGFVAGFALSWLVAPGGRARLRRLRERARDAGR